jgi:hypothetical protein
MERPGTDIASLLGLIVNYKENKVFLTTAPEEQLFQTPTILNLFPLSMQSWQDKLECFY